MSKGKDQKVQDSPVNQGGLVGSILTDEQKARIQALKAGREILTTRNFVSSTGPDVVDVIDLAEFVLSGQHPEWKRQDEGECGKGDR